MKKTIITGGAGFIGSHIAEELVQQGYKVIVLDNLRTGFKENLDGLDVEFVEGDVLNKGLIRGMAQNVEAIFHLAALVSVPESLQRIQTCLQINTIGTLNILDVAKEANCHKTVLSSSAAVYGDDPVLPKLEHMIPEPLTPYAITKLDGEYYMDMYRNQWGVPTVSLRYFNVFGPRQSTTSAYAAVVPIFIKSALGNRPLVVYGDGKQTRDFVYVKDVVRANLYAMNKGHGVYNVALGQSISVLELAEKIIDFTNSRSPIEFRNERMGDIRYSRASMEKFQSLGFKTRYSLDEGLKDTVAYYESMLSKE